MAVEGAVVQHHALGPLQAIENGTRPGHRANGKTRAQSFTEGAEVRLESVVFLTPAWSITETRDHFIHDEQCAVIMGQIADFLQISIAGQDAAHVGHDGLSDDGGQVPPMFAQNTLQRHYVIPRGQHYIVKRRCGNAC